jgi:hypothetical protein
VRDWGGGCDETKGGIEGCEDAALQEVIKTSGRPTPGMGCGEWFWLWAKRGLSVVLGCCLGLMLDSAHLAVHARV